MRYHSLPDWLDWQDTLHPQRIELRLERVATVWSRLWTGPLPAPVITVGGTNGKGSCVALLDGCYRAAGYRTGTYTSPHLLRYNERICRDGQPVDDAALCDAFAQIDAARADVPLTYFEFGTLAALFLFTQTAPDVIILEVGLGGRLDAVNIIDADVALITTIAHDHTAWLGDTLAQIAHEKAGIGRPQRPALIGQRDAHPALRERLLALGATVAQLGHEFDWQWTDATAPTWEWQHTDGTVYPALPLPVLMGAFQLDNAAAVCAAIHCLQPRLPLPLTALQHGLAHTQLAGRFQVLAGAVPWIVDVAHNPAAAATLVTNLLTWQQQRGGRIHGVLALLNDKDAAGFVAHLAPVIDHWHLTVAASERALPLVQLAAAVAATASTAPVHCHADVAAAITAARAHTTAGDTLLITGSFVTVAAAMVYHAEWLAQQN